MAERRIAIVLTVAGIVAAVALALWWRERERVREVSALEKQLHALLERAHEAAVPVPPFGLSAAFVLPDGRTGAAASGVADSEAEVAMTPACRFMAGSVGKSFFAALARALEAEGRLDLDEPIARWLGDERWFDRLPNHADLTLRLLLQHRSGLIDHIRSFEFVARSLAKRLVDGQSARMTPRELIEIALDRDPLFPAGEGFEYGDTNYVLAGLVMERVTGRSPFEEVEERFLERFGIEEVVVAWDRDVPKLCPGYQLPVNPFLLPYKMAENGRLAIDPMVEYTGGGLAMSPRGAARWAHLLFGGEVLGADVVDALVGHTVETGDGRRYGLGVFVYDTDLGTAWGHGGFFPGYRSELRYFPAAEIAVAVQANRDILIDLESIVLEVARVVVEGRR